MSKNAFDMLTARKTGMRGIKDMQPMPLMYMHPSKACREVQDLVFEYTLYAEVGTVFRCTDEDYEQARKHARAMLVREVYGEVLKYIGRLHVIAHEGKASALHEELARLEDWISG